MLWKQLSYIYTLYKLKFHSYNHIKIQKKKKQSSLYYTLSINRLWKSISIARKFITRILNDEKIALELTLTPHQRSLKNVHPEFISRNTHRLPKGLSESEAKRSNERKREKFLPNVFRSDSKNTKKYSWLTEIEVEISEERQQPERIATFQWNYTIRPGERFVHTSG